MRLESAWKLQPPDSDILGSAVLQLLGQANHRGKPLTTPVACKDLVADDKLVV